MNQVVSCRINTVGKITGSSQDYFFVFPIPMRYGRIMDIETVHRLLPEQASPDRRIKKQSC